MKRIVLIAAAALLAGAGLARAAESFAKVRAVITTVDYMRSVRSAAMGGTGTADPSSASNVLVNPANVIGAGGASVWYQYDDSMEFPGLDDDANAGGVSYASPLPASNGWRLGATAGYDRLSTHVDNLRTVFAPEGTGTGVDLDRHVTSATGALARVQGPFTFVLGVTGRYVSFDGFTYDATGFRLDSGAYTGWVWDTGLGTDWRWENARGDVASVRAGVAWRNLDTGFDDEGIDGVVPNEWRYGVGFGVHTVPEITQPISKQVVSAVSIALDADVADREFHDRTGVAMGVELGLAEMLYLRAGGVGDMAGYSDGGTWGVGLALDFGVVRTRLDVSSYRFTSYVGESDDRTMTWGVTMDYRR